MAIQAQSKLTSQGQVSVPAAVRRRLGLGPGATLEWVEDAVGRVVVRRASVHDSAAVHAFTFTPSMSLYVRCEDEAEIDRVFAALSAGGQILMPLEQYPFSKKFGWLADRFGVSWQLSLE